MRRSTVSRMFGSQPVEEPPIPPEQHHDDPGPAPAPMDWPAAKSLLVRGWRASFAVLLQMAGSSGQGVETVNDSTKAGDGASIAVRTPFGIVTIRVAADGSGCLVVHLPPPPPEPEPQPEPQPEPPADELEPDPEPVPSAAPNYYGYVTTDPTREI